ncbi:TPR-like protein [Rickenella mellea]|uniref:TPR-like protein n=1 Tax=Rickenella mellea TaxID=50990 RepID=A0A4Y7QM92_9AGAM|nr:TPR-like protein [Rickenella mellea]
MASSASQQATQVGDSREQEEAHIKGCLRDSEALKVDGTDLFRSQKWSEALATYRAALGRLPKRVIPPPNLDPDSESDDENGERQRTEPTNDELLEPLPLSDVELELAKARAILNANIGACHVKMNEHSDAVKACTEALVDDPRYVKALQRRATSNENLSTWASLSSAQEDYQTLLKILPPDSPQIRPTKRALDSVKPRAEAAQKRETAEMLDKLKGLGNSILGNFGLSTDNFKFEPNGQGGYSMNFSK